MRDIVYKNEELHIKGY